MQKKQKIKKSVIRIIDRIPNDFRSDYKKVIDNKLDLLLYAPLDDLNYTNFYFNSCN